MDVEAAVRAAILAESKTEQGIHELAFSVLHHPETFEGMRGWAVLRFCERCDTDHQRSGNTFLEALGKALDPSFCPKHAEPAT